MTHTSFSPRPGVTIAYNRTEGGAGGMPGALFMGGFRSDMTGTKATFLETRCAARGQAFLRFDYTGHGRSSGTFEDGALSDWLQDSLDVLDTLTGGPQVVIGSSMGGWLALRLALQRPERVAALILLAPAPDFTKDLWEAEFGIEERRHLEQKGVVYRPSGYGDPYPLTRRLFEDAKQHLLLHAKIPVRCPVRLIHGKQDPDVPWQKSRQIQDRLAAPDSRIIWVEDGDHRLSRPQDLELIDQTLVELSGTRRRAAAAD
jgi:pimeloyl-ACP methyl ester carboxylesterase